MKNAVFSLRRNQQRPPARRTRSWWQRLSAAGLALGLAACATAPAPAPAPVVQSGPPAPPPAARISGQLTSVLPPIRPSNSYGAAAARTLPMPESLSTQGDVSLDFANTDIRTVIAQILGAILQQTYTIDPAVQGTATLNTVTPLARDALIPVLQTLLAQNNAVLVRTGGLYQVIPAVEAAALPSLAGGSGLGGAVVVPLRYAQAAPMAEILESYITATTRINIAEDQNALVVSGEPSDRNALVALIQAFDTDELAGQSYKLFPVTGGDAESFAAAFSAALNTSSNPSMPGPIRVLPLERMNAVLVIARSEAQLFDAQRVYAVLNQVERQTLRSWYVDYLHNGRANDAAYVLQQAFTPDNVTAQPTSQATGQVSTAFANQSGASPAPSSASTGTAGQSDTPAASAPPGPPPSGGATTDAIRIIPDTAHNAVLIYATAAEESRINAMLDRVDISPVEVRIDAVIAEVDLNGALQYGTQFFFKSGGINAVLSEGDSSSLATNFPGFVLSGHGADAAPLAISLLQSVTKVNVLSSPELMVLDGQSASLQVGDLVPYLTQTSQSTDSTGAPVINSVNYRETGVILQVTPHVGSGGQVTLDVAQEISGVQPSVTTAGVNSPTFSERAVTSRVAIQDGQTVGLAGLISDSDSHQNQGVPYLKNVPLLGDAFGSQTNQRTRTELLVLITPHVVRTQSDAADLTADLRAALPNASAVPTALSAPPSGHAADPDQNLRSQLPR
jgi:general secretion pathway protein D